MFVWFIVYLIISLAFGGWLASRQNNPSSLRESLVLGLTWPAVAFLMAGLFCVFQVQMTLGSACQRVPAVVRKQ